MWRLASSGLATPRKASEATPSRDGHGGRCPPAGFGIVTRGDGAERRRIEADRLQDRQPGDSFGMGARQPRDLVGQLRPDMGRAQTEMVPEGEQPVGQAEVVGHGELSIHGGRGSGIAMTSNITDSLASSGAIGSKICRRSGLPNAGTTCRFSLLAFLQFDVISGWGDDMSKASFLGLCLALFFIGPARAQSWTTYDTFSEGPISPSKWSTGAQMCGTANTFDCERRVENQKLVFDIATYGSRNTSSGINVDGVSLAIQNFPIYKGLLAKVEFNSFTSIGCAANSSYSHPQFIMTADSFNTGGGDFADDVRPILIAEHPSGSHAGLAVSAFVAYQSGFFGNIYFGQYALSTEHTFSLYWNRAKSRFDFAVDGVTKSIPYTLKDATGPNYPNGSVGINNFVPNCQASATEAAMLATISSVSVSK